MVEITWFKVDDGLFANPKWGACSPHARALWVTAGSWAGKQEDSGKVPRHMLAFLGGRPRDAAELVKNGLWEIDPEGWRFHDWFDFQPSPEQIEAKRAAAAERQRKWRDKQRESRRDEHETDGVGHAPPDPTRPDPVPDPENPSSSSSLYDSFRGGSRVDDDDLEEARQRVAELIESGVEILNVPAYTATVLRDIRESRGQVWHPNNEGCCPMGCDNGYDEVTGAACRSCIPPMAARGQN